MPPEDNETEETHAAKKKKGFQIHESSPSVDPISRMVAQLPESERTAHLASELVAAQALERKRKVLEYTYFDKELRRAKSELERMDQTRLEQATQSAESSKLEEKLSREDRVKQPDATKAMGVTGGEGGTDGKSRA